jgi:hypothetical protein
MTFGLDRAAQDPYRALEVQLTGPGLGDHAGRRKSHEFHNLWVNKFVNRGIYDSINLELNEFLNSWGPAAATLAFDLLLRHLDAEATDGAQN